MDDQSEVRELIEVTLRIGNYDILQAENGPNALELARQELPDLMLLDVNMPNGDLDGFEVCEILKNDPKTTNITIVMLTALDHKADQELGLKAGADDYFIKPFSPLKLMNKVEEVLG